MKPRFNSTRNLKLPLGRSTIVLGASWLVVFAAGVWAIGAIYVPIVGAFLNPIETWTLAILIGLLSGASLIGHVLAHMWSARMTGGDIPSRLPLYPLGDAAQVWPAAPTAWREAVVAIAGPLAHLIIAALTYLLWNAQLDPYLNTITLFLAILNAGLAAVNLTPAFPLDGGRLLRAIMWGVLARPALASQLGIRLGVLTSALLIGWSIILVAQRARFSWPTAAVSLAWAVLMLLPLIVQPAWKWDRPEPSSPSLWSTVLVRIPLAALLLFVQLIVTLSLVPTNNGLQAPGLAAAVGPMVEVPAQYRHPVAGRFLLTSVYSQTPITLGEWILGQLSPVIRLVPPERIVPPDTTVQELARRNYRMLDDSQTSAIAVGLGLAGFEVSIQGLGARVLSVLPESPSHGVLQPNDVIIGLDGEPIETVAELTHHLRTRSPQVSVGLQVERDGRTVDLDVPLMPQSEPEQPPRIGITVEDAGFDVELPFPVEIVPQKIVGGPSAGLMFTLTVYDLLTSEDLTGGRTIAGTGTINLDGRVGPIGGVQQKVAGAELAGAEYFLSPPENFEDAQAVALRIKVVEVTTAEDAIDFLRRLPPEK